MKITVSSYSLSAYRRATGCDDFAICRMAKELGFDGIEFTELKPEDSGSQTQLEAAEKLRAYCAELALPIVAYAVGADLLAEDVEKEMTRLRAQVDVAAALGAPLMRHDVAYSLPARAGYAWQDGVAEMAPRIREITAYAAARGVRTCTENHGYLYQDPERVEALIRAVGHENYGWLFDMGNFYCADVSPVRALAHAAPYIFHVHAKDFIMKSGECIAPEGFFQSRNGNYLRGTVIGHGDVETATVVAALKRMGYDGCLTVEFEGLEENIPALKQGLAYLRRITA